MSQTFRENNNSAFSAHFNLFLAVPARRSHHRLMEHTRHKKRASLKVTILQSLDRWKTNVILHPTSWNYQHFSGFVLLEINLWLKSNLCTWCLMSRIAVNFFYKTMISLLLWRYKSHWQNMLYFKKCNEFIAKAGKKKMLRYYVVILSGLLDEMRSALSSPVLDSPNSSADFTLDTTGELTVEDVKDFLMWVLFTHLFWSIRVAFILGSPPCFAALGLWMKLRITTGTWLKRMGGLLEFSSTEASRQTAGGEEHLQHKQALCSVESRRAIYYWRQKGGVLDWGTEPCWAWRVFNVQIHPC